MLDPIGDRLEPLDRHDVFPLQDEPGLLGEQEARNAPLAYIAGTCRHRPVSRFYLFTPWEEACKIVSWTRPAVIGLSSRT
jgi:hypothetical protein